MTLCNFLKGFLGKNDLIADVLFALVFLYLPVAVVNVSRIGLPTQLEPYRTPFPLQHLRLSVRPRQKTDMGPQKTD